MNNGLAMNANLPKAAKARCEGIASDWSLTQLGKALTISGDRGITIEKALLIVLANERAERRLGGAFPRVPHYAKGGDIRRKRVAKDYRPRLAKAKRKVKRDPQVWRVSKRQRLLSTSQVLSEGTKI